MPSSRTTKQCVVTQASLGQDGSYMLHLQDASKPGSPSTVTVQKPNGIMNHRCRALLDFPGFPQGTRCLKGFGSASQLKMHHRSVHEVQPFGCLRCNFITVDGSNFDKHDRICQRPPGEPEKGRKCEVCGRKDARSDNSKRHQKTCKGTVGEQQQQQPQQQQQEQQQQQQQPSGYGPVQASYPPFPVLESRQLDLEAASYLPSVPVAFDYYTTLAAAPAAATYGADYSMGSGLDSTLRLPATTLDFNAPMDSNFVPALTTSLALPAFPGDNNFSGNMNIDPALNSASNPFVDASFAVFGDTLNSTVPTDNSNDVVGGNMNIDLDANIDTAIFGNLDNLDPSLSQELGLSAATTATTGQTLNSYDGNIDNLDPSLSQELGLSAATTATTGQTPNSLDGNVDDTPAPKDNQPLAVESAAINSPEPIKWDDWLVDDALNSSAGPNDPDIGTAPTPKDTNETALFVPMADFVLEDFMRERLEEFLRQ